MSLPTTETVNVFFPCVHGLGQGRLITINTFQSEELKGTVKIVTGIDEEIGRRIIGATRYNETDARAGTGVMVLFSSPLFSGESYGLALAIGDKLARYQSARTWSDIYATGMIPADGCGAIESVGSFNEKLELIVEVASPDSLLVFPKSQDISDPSISQRFKKLESLGVECFPADSITELEGILWKEKSSIKDKENETKHVYKTSSKKTGLILAGISLIGLGCYLGYAMINLDAGKSVSSNKQMKVGTQESTETQFIKELNADSSPQEKAFVDFGGEQIDPNDPDDLKKIENQIANVMGAYRRGIEKSMDGWDNPRRLHIEQAKARGREVELQSKIKVLPDLKVEVSEY